jgi:hypothetical protein
MGVVVPLVLAGACDDGNSSGAAPFAPKPAIGSCSELTVDRFKELIVAEPSVVDDARSRNGTAGPWSFRHLVEEMAPPGVTASDFVQTWLGSLKQATNMNLFQVPSRPRLNEVLICPWLRATPENACNALCSSCAAQTLDLAKAPFRLIAFANRIDLSTTDERSDSAGESRLVYVLTQGPGDNPASVPLPMTVIFEYQNPNSEGRDTRYWTKRWHALGAYADYDSDFLAELDALYADITTRPADRSSWINQVRTNDVALDWLWDLREFKLTDNQLRLAPTQRTPDKLVNGSDDLTRFVLANKDAVLAGRYELPSLLNGGFVRLNNAPWRLPGVDEVTRHAFARQTCDGCHQSEEVSIDQGFHISPFRIGRDRLSPFLNDPADLANDELSRRSKFMLDSLCSDVATASLAR